jgi:hypothetical protein
MALDFSNYTRCRENSPMPYHEILEPLGVHTGPQTIQVIQKPYPTGFFRKAEKQEIKERSRI